MTSLLPFRIWTANYQRSFLGADLVSGLSVWAVLVPTALAYSSLVGVSPIIGLYCIPLVLLAYALFGGSRLLVVGPDASIAVLAGATLASVGYGADDLGLAVSLTLIVGAIYVGFWLVRLGWISDLIPDPVLKGMIEGIAWVTILKETVVLLGIELSGEHARFFPKLFELVQRVPTLHMTTAALGIAVLLALLLFHKFAPRFPAAFFVLGVSILAVYGLNLDASGVAVVGHAGEQSMGLGAITLPDLEKVFGLLPGALSIVVIGFTLSMAAAKRAAEKTGDRLDPNQELLAMGACHVGCGISGGYPVAGTLSKTMVAMEAGGKTQLGNLFTGLLGLVTIFLLLPVFEPLANAALSGLVIFVMYEVSDIPYFIRLWKVRKLEFAIAVLSFVGVLAYDPLGGVIVGAVLALIVVGDHVSRPPHTELVRNDAGEFLPRRPNDASNDSPGILIWRFYGPLVFLNARRLSEIARSEIKVRGDVDVFLLDASANSGTDSTGAAVFARLQDELKSVGIEFWVANARTQTWERTVATLEQLDLPAPRSFHSLDQAFDAFTARQLEDRPSG